MHLAVRRLATAALAIALGLAVFLVAPVAASDPATSDVTAVDGQTVTSEWTGSIPPGVGEGVECDASTTRDEHQVTITVPAGLEARAQFFLEYGGSSDQKMAVVLPDGTVVTEDGGFVGTSESLTISPVVSGTYTYYACPYLSLAPQDYAGRVEVSAGDPSDGGVGPAAHSGTVCPAPAAPTFAQEYIDTTRAGGEPIIVTHPDGQLLWGSHAGTTHFFGPAAPAPGSAAFVMNYEGQTYQYVSEDDGVTWTFVPRTPVMGGAPDSGVPNTGFSDPEFAIDTAGNVYISEINLANIALSKSTDGGRSYTLQSIIEITASDRQWMEADEEDVVWFVANTFGGGSTSSGEPVTGSLSNRIYKSTDGGVTFTEGQDIVGAQASSDIKVDRSDGRVYQLFESGGTFEMIVFPNARQEEPPNMTFERYTIAEGIDRGSTIGPTFELDAQGNLYVVWDDLGAGDFEQGIYTSYSTDRGVTWAPPTRVDDGQGVPIWPWLAVGDRGNVAVTWLQHDGPAEPDDLDDNIPTKGHPSEFTEGTWDVKVAISQNGLGCDAGTQPGFTTVTASTAPVHEGTVCNGGTLCQAAAIDRRLGDYFANTVTQDGEVVIAISDTMSGGAVALPLVIRQTGGPSLVGAPVATGDGGTTDGGTTDGGTDPAPTATDTAAGQATGGTGMPATGGGLALLGLVALAGATVARRR